MNREHKRILVIRNDKIGDFMLAWPSFALLKKQYPDAKITALVPEYTADLAEQCEWIDSVLIDIKDSSYFRDIFRLSQNLKRGEFDASISLFSQSRSSIALWLAGIKERVGPATKIAQLFLNNTLRQKRSSSLKPEFEYNLDLIKHYINGNNDKPIEVPRAPYLKFPTDEIQLLRDQIKRKHHIPDDSKIIIIHPGTGGSAINLSTKQYAELIKLISDRTDACFIITAGPGEKTKAISVSEQIPEICHHVFESTNGIINFCKFIACCDLFISGSTGPLHIAGALDIPTIAFYPRRKSATALRWKTLNTKDNHIDFSPDDNTNHASMSSVDLPKSASTIIKFLQNHSDYT